MNFPLLPLTLTLVTTLGSAACLQAGMVTNILDGGPGSLRAAITSAINGETITFDSSLNGETITLTTGGLSISGKELTIDASSLPSGIKISGNNNSRIFTITANANVSLNSLELFNGRSLNGNGGGIYALQSELNCVNITIRNCVSTYDGGGLWANGVTGSFDRCSFVGNDSGGYGGGIFLIGATVSTYDNSVISGNRSPAGGGIAALNASPSITNCTIQGNSGTGFQMEFASAPNLRNTTIWGNRTGEGSIGSQQIRTGPSSSAVADVDYCLVEGVPSTLNNLDGTLPANDPQFVNPATPDNASTPPSTDADVRVSSNSPIINVGDNDSCSTSFDRDGLTRIQATTIDLGAFEDESVKDDSVTFALLHPTLSREGDANGNGISNFVDYATGFDPTAPDEPAARPTFSTSGGSNFLTSSHRTNGADVSPFWEMSTNLETFSWQNMVSGIDYTIESTSNPAPNRQQMVFKLLGAGDRRFYRQGFASGN